MKLRDYQLNLANRGNELLKIFGIVYFVIEMRVGKTLISLKTAELYDAKKVLFVSKKKALASINNDYINFNFDYEIDIINYEQLKKYKEKVYDIIIVDEAHSLGAFPKPSERAKLLKNIAKNNSLTKIILLSGTPTPESYSQLYHQFWISNDSPFRYDKFYSFAKEYVHIKEVNRNGLRFREYKDCNKEQVMKIVDKYFVRYTQRDAGFIQSEVIEEIIKIPVSENIKKIINILKKYRYYKFSDGEEVICDTAVKLQSKLHQAFSGTIKTNSEQSKILDISKALYIKQQYKNKKISIFYKYIAEGEVLKKIIPNWTDNPEQFNNEADCNFICQIQSGSMGVNLSASDILIYYNIDFSALQYWQSRARLQDFKRIEPAHVHWLFMENGIEERVYKAVLDKKNYTLSYFQKDYLL